MTNVNFLTGSAEVEGGCMYINDANATLANVYFQTCSSAAGNGGGIYANSSTMIATLNDCFFNDSSADVCGGASHIY